MGTQNITSLNLMDNHRMFSMGPKPGYPFLDRSGKSINEDTGSFPFHQSSNMLGASHIMTPNSFRLDQGMSSTNLLTSRITLGLQCQNEGFGQKSERMTQEYLQSPSISFKHKFKGFTMTKDSKRKRTKKNQLKRLRRKGYKSSSKRIIPKFNPDACRN